MKYLLFVLLLLVVRPTWAQRTANIAPHKLPLKVQKAFESKYPQAQVKQAIWQEVDTSYQGQFWDEANGIYVLAYFDEAGKWLKSEMEVEPSAFTMAIKRFLEKEYNDRTISYVLATQHPLGNYTYWIVLENETEILSLELDAYAKILYQEVEQIQVKAGEGLRP